MKQINIKRSSDKNLIILFAGWAMDINPFRNMMSCNKNYMICYDYSDLNFDIEKIKEYNDIRIIGWSMGVWAAAYIIDKWNIEYSQAIAINGTLTPISDESGIPTSVYMGTLNTLTDKNLIKFFRRMCYGRDAFQQFLTITPKRFLKDIKEELEFMAIHTKIPLNNNIKWSKIIVGKNDLIFPYENQLNAWKNKKLEHIELQNIAHFDFNLFCELLK